VPVLSALSQLRLDAADAESGLASVSLISGGTAVAQSTFAALTTTAYLGFPNGKFDIVAQAADRVGNVRQSSYSFVLDTKPPRLQSVEGYAYEGAKGTLPPLFAYRISTTTLTFVVTDDVTGPCDLQIALRTDPFAVATRVQDGGECGAGAGSVSSTGATRTFHVAFHPAGSANPDLEAVEFFALPRDYAGNLAVPESSPLHRLLIVPYAGCSTPCVLSAKGWNQRAHAAEAQRFKSTAASLGLGVPSAKPGQSDQGALEAAWLNFLSGRLAGTRTRGGKSFSADCELVDSDGEAYDSLSNMTACAERGRKVATDAAALGFIPK
jgi:hypothetical protein